MLKIGIDVIEDEIFQWNHTILEILLKDKTSKRNIIWATEDYPFPATEEIKIESITKNNSKIIQPRVCKNIEKQDSRTKKNAEVFTPAWVCNKQNNLLDEAWFERKNIFNIETEDGTWKTIEEKVIFPEDKSWQDYTYLKRLEISCGEAPYLVSRYDATKGEMIPIEKRVGLLDRKLRIINENTDDFQTWYEWVVIAFKSIYGYEYQGDNVLLARENLLITFSEYLEYKFNRQPKVEELKKIANIIAWNIFQMDATTYSIPEDSIENRNVELSHLTEIDIINHNFKKKYEQLSFFDDDDFAEEEKKVLYCKVKNWRANKTIEFRKLAGR